MPSRAARSAGSTRIRTHGQRQDACGHRRETAVKAARRGAAQNIASPADEGAKMSEPTDDAGTIQALLERLVKFRLPRTLAIKQRTDGGERLTDSDIAFLKNALEDAHHASKFVGRNPKFHELGVQIVQLYDDIVRKALENEKDA